MVNTNIDRQEPGSIRAVGGCSTAAMVNTNIDRQEPGSIRAVGGCSTAAMVKTNIDCQEPGLNTGCWWLFYRCNGKHKH